MESAKQDIKKCALHCVNHSPRQGGHETVGENWRGHIAWAFTISIFLP